MPNGVCPHCGNIVEGKKVKTYANKVTRQGAKTAVHMATSAGGMATGAAVGSAILPGVGTLVGGALGFLGSAMFNQKVNEGIDLVGDTVEDEFLMMDYEFCCPKCRYKWNSAESSNLNSHKLTPPTQKDEVSIQFDLYMQNRRMDAIKYFIQFVVGNQIEGHMDYMEIKDQIYRHTMIFVLPKQIEANTKQETCETIFKILSNKENIKKNWFDIVKRVPHSSESDAFRMKVYSQNETTKFGNILSGIITSGTVAMGDDVILYTNSNTKYNAKIVTIELYGKETCRAKAGDSLGLGVDVDLNSCSGRIDYICKCNEHANGGYGINTLSMIESEQEYLNELKDILADGEISPREHRLLEKIRVNLNISESRAAELEATLSSPQLTPEEQEYLNEYKEIISEGEVSSRDKRYLDKLKKTNGISDMRANEIEKMTK